ncbi:MAG TPA: ATP-binding cassette domain-containing protein [Gemmatimonadaceae bacterium]|nr:ATP-binding cassette domain-containing protein [Gemmatimonadaceae bacterium]
MILELHGITKRFGGVVALEEASLRLRRGTVHALLGENGAGKTTLMRIADGLIRPDAGELRLRGAPFMPRSPADAMASGLAMVHQHYAIVPPLTVAEHVALVLRGRYDPLRAAEIVRQIGARTGLTLDPSRLAGDLGVAAQQRLEIMKALATDAEVLILDEPTAVLTPAESGELLSWMGAFRASGGSVVLITHKLREALGIADDLTVLRRGRVVLAGRREELSREQIVTAMLGHSRFDLGMSGAWQPATNATVVTASALELRDAHGAIRIRGADFQIGPGELIGVAAVEGSGHRELLRALSGRMPPAAGTLRLPTRVGFIPEDRQRDALALDMTIAENLALAGAGARRGAMNWRAIERRARRLLKANGLGAMEPHALAGTLSGGNQQKLVLARELDEAPPLVVAENPTRGLDLQSTDDVFTRLRAARAAGAALVVYSSDLDEVLALADRVLVVFGGSVREVPKDRDSVGRAMLGAA